MEELLLKVARDPIRQAKRRENLAIWKEKELPLLKEKLFKKQKSTNSTLSLNQSSTLADSNEYVSLSSTATNHDPLSESSSASKTEEASSPITELVNTTSKSPTFSSTTLHSTVPPSALASEPEELDPLDQFMVNVTTEVEKIHAEDQEKLLQMEKLYGSKNHLSTSSSSSNTDQPSTSPSMLPSRKEENAAWISEDEVMHEEEEEEDILAYAAKKLAKKKDIQAVDHSAIAYPSFRKDFYIEPPELACLTHDQVKQLRQQLDGIRVVGKDCPKPAQKWTHCGLPVACLDVIKKLAFPSPTPIQAQAIPAIMSGRDVIGVAKTGSGKTLAFLLPLFRHLKDQPALAPGEGPIALIMTPTRELAMQIHKEAKLFSKPLGLRSVCCYGGSPISDQIADLKRGAEIMVCTPGRLIDLLCANAGRVTNLRRVTYLVLDEADRMFDMGFEPQVMKIVTNVQPKRQTVLFSATFPKPMEALARKILHHRPLEITVGQKAVVAMEVVQVVEVRDEHTKFLRLLEILGQAFSAPEEPRVLVFVDRQEAADHLMSHLMKRSYVCNSLHGGKDQMDRDITLADFKAGHVPILIATSVAARGLDVKGLNVVINFDCPNHKEDYIHRVGRTGRAGQKGTAYTFITKEQERYAPDIMEALRASKAEIPEQLKTLANAFKEKVKAGQAQSASKGFGGKGLEKLDKERESLKKVQKLTHGVIDEEDEEEQVDQEARDIQTQSSHLAISEETELRSKEEGPITTATSSAVATSNVLGTTSHRPNASMKLESISMADGATMNKPPLHLPSRFTTEPPGMAGSSTPSLTPNPTTEAGVPKPTFNTGAARAQDIIQQLNLQMKAHSSALSSLQPSGNASASSSSTSSSLLAAAATATPAVEPARIFNYTFEFEINDYPQRARWKVTNKDQINQICEVSGAAITTRGFFFPSGKIPKEGERKLYLFIEGETQLAVDKAKHEINRILKEATLATVEMELKSGLASGRYSVV